MILKTLSKCKQQQNIENNNWNRCQLGLNLKNRKPKTKLGVTKQGLSTFHSLHTDVLKEFKNEVENLDSICEEKAKGMLSLYEASFLAMEGESFLDEARHIAIQYLSEYLKSTNNDQIICTMITHALELPFHWRMPRLEARWFINVYRTKPDPNPVLLELAKLDFNIVQSTHHDDLKYVSR